MEATILLSARLDRDALDGTAADAWLRFGRGRHPASLNFGDCFAYATARLADEPLLFTGDALARTDVRVASY